MLRFVDRRTVKIPPPSKFFITDTCKLATEICKTVPLLVQSFHKLFNSAKKMMTMMIVDF